jgi:hypothetical protein
MFSPSSFAQEQIQRLSSHLPHAAASRRLVGSHSASDARTFGGAARVGVRAAIAALAFLAPMGMRAEAAPLAPSCSTEVVQGLARVGGWAVAQCAPQETLGLDGLPAQQIAAVITVSQPDDARCSLAVVDGLARVGGWAAAACMTGAGDHER